MVALMEARSHPMQAAVPGEWTRVDQWVQAAAAARPGEAAVEYRGRSLSYGALMAAADQLLLSGAHMPFPGFGKVLKAGTAFRFVPAEWSYTL